ncbi:MAG: dihydropteridine reductase [Oscillospiraceae bacterium]|nr:dihydropteridine reductase [Oscillospiraceae bacterium]
MNTDKIVAESIAKDYAPKDTSKIVALKKLDHKARAKAEIFGYTFGVIMTLVFGTGLCLAMGVIGGGTVAMMVLGIVIGVVGIVGVSVNYPIYKKLLESGKKQYASDILRLAKEISDKAE